MSDEKLNGVQNDTVDDDMSRDQTTAAEEAHDVNHDGTQEDAMPSRDTTVETTEGRDDRGVVPPKPGPPKRREAGTADSGDVDALLGERRGPSEGPHSY